MENEKKEPTPVEKLQVEYNQLCAQEGHLSTQVRTFIKQRKSIRERLEKIVNKATNIPKEKIEEAKPIEAKEVITEVKSEEVSNVEAR